MAINGWDRAAQIMEQCAGARPRPRPRPAPARPVSASASVAELGNKLDQLTALVESVPVRRAPIRENVPAPTPEPEVDVSPEALAKLSADEFKALSALRWSRNFDHLTPGGSPYARSGTGRHPLADDSDTA